MLDRKVLVREIPRAVDTRTPRTVAIDEVSTLYHEPRYLFLSSQLRILSTSQTISTIENGSQRRKRRERREDKTDHPVEPTPFIPHRPTTFLVLPRAQLAEVLRRPGHGVGEEFDLHPPQGFSGERDVEEYHRVGRVAEVGVQGKRGRVG